MGRGFTRQDKVDAQGLDADVNYFDDAETERQTSLQFDDDVAGAVIGDSRAAD